MPDSASGAGDMPLVKSPIPYRAHIDGLRGISIIAMILYHAKFFYDTGGFIGVDIFFVISGFLITSIIVRDVRAGSFSLIGFWERRIRRIIPPLFIIMVFTVICGYFLMLYPQDYHHLGNAVAAQSIFVSNILFSLTDNYFDQSALYSPLLHTWTLSVEEQFYVLFPFIVLVCIYAGRRWFNHRSHRFSWEKLLLWSATVIGIVSFALNIYFINIAPSNGLWLPFVPQGILWQTSLATAGFYLLPTRAWEIALGIVLALSSFKIRSKLLAEIASIGGLALIVGAVFLLNPGTAYPGVAALLPTLGTCLIIAANEERATKIGKFLSSRLLVGIGLISYSLYLWYWPLFVFTGILTLFAPTPLDYCLAIALALVLAILTYRYVETPIRRRRIFTTTKKAYIFGIGSLALLGIVGLAIQQTAFAQNNRIPASAQAILTAASQNSVQTDVYFQLPGDAQSYSDLERLGDHAASSTSFVVFGDSQADAMASLFDALGKKYGLQGAMFSGGSCIPLPDVHESPPATGCDEMRTQALDYIQSHNVKYVFLVARWSYYVMGGPTQARVAFITDSGQITTSPQEAGQVFGRDFPPFVQQLVSEGRDVIIVKQAPEQVNFDTHQAFYAAVRYGGNTDIQSVSASDNAAYQALANSVIDTLAGSPGVTIVDPTTILCTSSGNCPLQEGSQFLYRDSDHISTAGAMLLQPLFNPIFKTLR